jgi:ABC-type phosphate transport system substrate-binding protein
MRRISKLGIMGSGLCAIALIVGSAPAFADYAPSSTDVVGVGSDTVQDLVDFIADGDQNSDPGYNSVGLSNKLVSFDATPDANVRAGYLNGSTNASLKPLNPTIVLRAGTSPVQRPNGGSAGITALLNDHGGAGYVRKIDFVRSPRPPKASEEALAVSGLGTELYSVQLATDPLEIAYDQAASNIPAAGLTTAQLTAIYTCTDTTWNQVGGTSTNTIVPLIPQVGAGTRTTFLADIGVGGTSQPALGSCVQTVEQNDPTSITGNADPADAIVPFSAARLALYNSGYFHDPTVAFPGGASVAPGILLKTGTGTGASQIYNDIQGLYVIFRASDVSSTTPWQSGSSLNWVHTLFVNTSPTVLSYADQSFNQALISAAGATPNYVDRGAGYTVG